VSIEILFTEQVQKSTASNKRTLAAMALKHLGSAVQTPHLFPAQNNRKGVFTFNTGQL